MFFLNSFLLNKLKRTIKTIVNGIKIPIIAGTGANSTQEAVDLTRESQALGEIILC